MTPDEFRQILLQTLHDRRLSRSEHRALAAALAEDLWRDERLGHFRRIAFELAHAALSEGARPGEVLAWLEDVVDLLCRRVGGSPVRPAEACFSPGDACVDRLCGLFQSTERSADVCVYTITDDRLADALLDAHRRGIAVRIVTDNDKTFDAGSDVFRLSAAGLSIRVDTSEHHMHHKFVLFDRQVLVTGSYNWTRSAAEYNEENLLVVYDPAALSAFQRLFDRLWARCTPLVGGRAPRR